jgi:hypothetical protein
MVKPPLRTKSIGFKVSEEEYARLETAAQASGRTLGEWCREAILRAGGAGFRRVVMPLNFRVADPSRFSFPRRVGVLASCERSRCPRPFPRLRIKDRF